MQKKNDLTVVTFIRMSILFKTYFMLAYFACCLKSREISLLLFKALTARNTLWLDIFVDLCSEQ